MAKRVSDKTNLPGGGQEKNGSLVYGYHISKESVMTCYIENRNAKHIHFVDGADGGNTEAAKKLKLKLKQKLS